MERVYTGPLLDKLGVRPGMRVALIEIDDDEIRPLLAERTSDITEGWPLPDTDIVLLGADSTEALAPLESLARLIRTKRRNLGRVAQGQGRDPARRRGDRRRQGRRAGRQQGRVVLADAHGAPPGHPGCPTAKVTARTTELRTLIGARHPRCTIRPCPICSSP